MKRKRSVKEEANQIKTRAIFILIFLLCLAGNSRAQKLHVTGKVITQDDKFGMPGVSIIVKGTTTGTVTNVDGDYAIDAPADGILVFSFIGMTTQEIPVNNKSLINVSLTEETTGLDEVVVVGYGVQKKVNLSGAVDAIDSKELESRPIINLSQGLQGVAPNLNIDFVSGEPGQAAQINIRGMTSINGGEPLILIDGVPADAWELNRLSPEDVSDISVLKDASSAAIYGARAAFGVVLITTKSGSKEGIHISYNNNMSWSKPTLLPNKINDPYIYMRLQELSSDNTPWDVINYSDETYAWAKERSDNPGETVGVRINPNDPSSWEYMGNKDWTYYFLDDYTLSQKHHLQLDGKTEKTRFYLSSSYDNENGALKLAEDNFKRYSIRSKVDYTPFKWLTIGNNTLFTMTERNEPSYLSIWDLYNFAPTSYDKNPDGTWANSAVGIAAAKLVDGGKVDNKYNSTQSTFNAEARFFDGALKVNSDFTIRKGTSNYGWYYSKYNIGYGPEDIREVGVNEAYRSATFDTYNVFNIYTTFNKTFNDHQLTALVGFNQEYSNSEWFSAQRDMVISSSLPTIALATGEDFVDESITDWAIRGAFYRLNYIFRDRYIVEFNGRYDGSSKFPKTSRFGFFPSASVAWRVDRENFMKSIEHVISTFKVRASYGSLGNQNVTAYGYIPTMNASEGSYMVDGELPQRVSPPQLVSDNYSWETVSTLNFGSDLGILKDKLYAAFDIYQRNTTGMLTQGKDLPDVLGASEPKENAADLQTNGWELTLTYKSSFNLASKPFNFSSRFILSDSRAWITGFDNPNKNLSQYYIGQEFGEIWGLESDGFYQTVEETQALDETTLIPWGALSIVPGWPKYVDQDGNGKIEKGLTMDDPKDAKIIGNTSPRFRFGLNLDFNWNGFDVRTFIQGIAKKDYYPRHYLYWGFYQQPYAGGYEHLTDFYRPHDDSEADMAKHSQAYIDAGLANANLDAKYPVLQAWLADRNLGEGLNSSKGLATPQTDYLLSAAYIRIKNVTVGYTLPKTLTQKVKLDRVRFFVSGENLAEWSEVGDYFDPEAVTDNGHGYAYPFQRRYSFGVNIDF
ncbi:TonB-dependent receptor [Maribellus luteus]|uniref:TonB-dependent receptor n=1 Tax=Maribellus luteus TaxID=2305463 RepID=A0A399TA41_9BACT|nr:TonB-dependent receptor [Maribellus luteus]RIJ50833.1 TonB-dependent receptor [Maribellus luteus]